MTAKPRPVGGRGIPLSAERKALIEECLRDGWPFIQIQKTYGVSWHTLNKYFHGQGMPQTVAASFASTARKVNRILANA